MSANLPAKNLKFLLKCSKSWCVSGTSLCTLCWIGWINLGWWGNLGHFRCSLISPQLNGSEPQGFSLCGRTVSVPPIVVPGC